LLVDEQVFLDQLLVEPCLGIPDSIVLSHDELFRQGATLCSISNCQILQVQQLL